MLAWFGELNERERRTMGACFGGWALDAFDVQMIDRRVGIEAQHFVDQGEIPIIVQQALIGGDFGVYANPKAHIPLEPRRMHERIGHLGACREVVEERREQQPERAYRDPSHGPQLNEQN